MDSSAHRDWVKEAAARGVIFVIITETDECLEKANEPARWPAGLTDFNQLIDTRHELKSLAEELTQHTPGSIIHLTAEAFDTRSERWRQALEHTLLTLNGLGQRKVNLPSAELKLIIERSIARSPAIALPLYRWLGEHGWPAR